MKSIKEMSIGELAAFICSHLMKYGIEVVLSGGGCVSIYTENKYASLDLDFIEFRGTRGKEKLKSILKEIGFSCKGWSRYFEHPDTNISLEFPTPPLAVGKELVKEISTITFHPET